MPNFVRMTKLSNISGRADYISNSKRQEDIVAVSAPIDWQPYAQYEQEHKQANKSCVEGRELIIALPNSWAMFNYRDMNYDEHSVLEQQADMIAQTAIGKNTDYQWAIHWNEAHTNLHMHVIFSERTAEKITDNDKNTQEKYTRDVYLTSDGHIATKKAHRATDENGKVKSPIHRKGDLKNAVSVLKKHYNQSEEIITTNYYHLSSKTEVYSSKKWLYDTKNCISEKIKELTLSALSNIDTSEYQNNDKVNQAKLLIDKATQDLNYEKPCYIAQIHEGKHEDNKPSESMAAYKRITAYNKAVRYTSAMLQNLAEKGLPLSSKLIQRCQSIISKGKIPIITDKKHLFSRDYVIKTIPPKKEDLDKHEPDKEQITSDNSEYINMGRQLIFEIKDINWRMRNKRQKSEQINEEPKSLENIGLSDKKQEKVIQTPVIEKTVAQDKAPEQTLSSILKTATQQYKEQQSKQQNNTHKKSTGIEL